MAQKDQAFQSITLAHIRSHGCPGLLIYCEDQLAATNYSSEPELPRVRND
jgi:hypothetical protein